LPHHLPAIAMNKPKTPIQIESEVKLKANRSRKESETAKKEGRIDGYFIADKVNKC